MTATTEQLNTVPGVHPVHGEFDCHDVEDANARGWAKVATLTDRVDTLTGMLVTAQRELAAATSDRDAFAASVDELNAMYLEVDESLGAALEVAAERELAAALLPQAEAAAAAVWRTGTGKARGPIPASWVDHLSSPEVSARISAALDDALAAALAAEFGQYEADAGR